MSQYTSKPSQDHVPRPSLTHEQVATATDWLTNFIVVEVTPIGLQNLGWQFYIVWTCTNAAFLPVLYLLYPETGKPAKDAWTVLFC